MYTKPPYYTQHLSPSYPNTLFQCYLIQSNKLVMIYDRSSDRDVNYPKVTSFLLHQ